MKVEIRSQQIAKSSWAFNAFDLYQKKLKHFCDFDFKLLKEGKSLLQNVDPQDFLILCDERGETLSSKDFAKKVMDLRDSGKKRIVIIVGGPFGADQEVKARANLTISLSSFVMNQEVALITIFEQIYRAYTIIHNHPYHNE